MRRARASRAVSAISAIGAALALALAGCGSSAKTTPAAPVTVPDQSIDAKPVSALKDGGTLRTIIQAYPQQWNGNQVNGQDGDWLEMDTVVLPHLFPLSPQGEPTANPNYLASAQVTSASPQVVTYELNPAAKWSSGTPLGWKDFYAMWQAMNGKSSAYIAFSNAGYNQISSVRQGASPQEVKVTFTSPFADWKSLFDPLYPAADYTTAAQFNKAWVNGPPITAGAWRIASLNQTAKTVTMTPDPGWWGPRPKLSAIVWQDLDASAITDAYLNNEIDLTSARAPETYKQLKNAPNTSIRYAGQLDETLITFSGTRGPLKDVRVRQAVMEAIDRDAIVRVAANGLPVHLTPLGNHLFMPNQPAYRDNSGQFGRYDPTAAGKLLDAAGWTRSASGKTRTRAGQPLKITITIPTASTSPSLQISELIQSMLAQVGIQLSIQQVSSDDFFTKYINVGDFDLTIFRQQPTPFLSTSMSPVFELASGANGGNFGGVGSPQIDSLLGQAAKTLSETTADALYNQADKLIWQAGHSLPLYQTPEIDAVRKDLANYGAVGLGSIDYAKVGFVR